MKLYKYETHAHTAEVSRCASISAADLVYCYKEMGYAGICITDHFLNGNTTVPRNLPWQDQIDKFCSGFDLAKRVGDKIGLDVFFGWEYSYKGTDLLTYGLDKEWLLNHPEVIDIDVNAYCDLVHDHQGIIVHAHPFREADYIDMIRLLPRKVDAVEIINACRSDFENILADQYANNYGLLKIAGSDNHVGKLPKMAGMLSKNRLTSIDELMQAILAQKLEIFVESETKKTSTK